VLDELAARRAAERSRADPSIAARGRRLIASGRAAVTGLDIRALVDADVGFHHLIYEASGNPLIATTAEPHWRFLRRVMADVLRHAEPPRAIWDQHETILEAIIAGDVETAGREADRHVRLAAERLACALEHRELQNAG
jgi:DNA-binding GntR family transcriptional regulator